MQDKKLRISELPPAEQERVLREAEENLKRSQTERKKQLADVEIVCTVETYEAQKVKPPAREMKPRHIGGGILLAPVAAEPEKAVFSRVMATFINHSAAQIDMGRFVLYDILEVAVFDEKGSRLPARIYPDYHGLFVSGYAQSIAPGGSLTKQLSPEAWADIKEPGTYRLDISTKGDVHSLMKIRNRTLTYTIEESKAK
jgi:hypothetical protein